MFYECSVSEQMRSLWSLCLSKSCEKATWTGLVSEILQTFLFKEREISRYMCIYLLVYMFFWITQNVNINHVSK